MGKRKIEVARSEKCWGQTQQWQPSQHINLFLCSPATTVGVIVFIRFLHIWSFNLCTGSYILTLGNSLSWRKLWKKNSCEWTGKADRQWKWSTTEGRKAKEKRAGKKTPRIKSLKLQSRRWICFIWPRSTTGTCYKWGKTAWHVLEHWRKRRRSWTYCPSALEVWFCNYFLWNHSLKRLISYTYLLHRGSMFVASGNQHLDSWLSTHYCVSPLLYECEVFFFVFLFSFLIMNWRFVFWGPNSCLYWNVAVQN